MSKNRLAIFDMDGTLFDTLEANYLAYRDALRPYGMELDFMLFKERCFGRHFRDFGLELLGEQATDEILADVHAEKTKFYRTHLSSIRVNDKLFHVISDIRASHYVALATTASKTNTDDLLEYFDKRDVFDQVLTRESVIKSKPDPEIFNKLMDYFGVCAENTLIFEDSETGINAAIASGAGLVTVARF